MSKGFLAAIVVVVLIFVGIFAFSGHKSGSNSSSSASNGQPTSHTEGKGQTGVTLVEYGDYQCPYCGEYFPIVEQVAAKYNDQIKFQFRNFPLINLHQNAFAAARAAEAASLQGKFWDMYRLIYEGQSQWSESNNANQFFQQYARQLGLNMSLFNRDYSSNQVNNAINADKAEGDKLNIQGTPTFFLDDKQLDNTKLLDASGKPSLSAFQKIIDTEIAQKQSQR